MTMEDLQRLLCPRRCRCAAIHKSRREQCRRDLLPRRESWTHVAYLTAVPLADAAAVGAMPESHRRGARGPGENPPFDSPGPNGVRELPVQSGVPGRGVGPAWRMSRPGTAIRRCRRVAITALPPRTP